MTKRTAMVTMLQLLVVCALCGACTANASDADVASLQTQVSALRAQLAQSAADNYQVVLTLNMQIAALQQASVVSVAAIAALQTRTSTIEGEARTLSSRVTATETNLTTLAVSITDVQTADAALTVRVTGTETNITKILAAATALTTRVSTAEASIVSLASSLTTVQTAASALTLRMTTAETNVANVTTRLSAAENMNGVATALTTTVASHTTQLAAVAVVDATQTNMLSFLATKPSCYVTLAVTGTQAISTTALQVVVKMDSFTTSGTNAASVFSFNSTASTLTLHGAQPGDADAGLTRRFSVTATLRLSSMNLAFFDWVMKGTNLIYTMQDTDTELSLSSTLAGIVTVAANSSLAISMFIGNVAAGSATIVGATRTYFAVAML